MAENARWYVIHTYSGYENKVAETIQKVVENRHLHELIPEIRVPTESAVEMTETKTKGTKAKEVEHKIFPCYVLVKMILTDESWYVVRNIRGVTGFVGPASKPVPLSDAEVAKISALGCDTAKIQCNFTTRDSVKILGGSLDGFVGIVRKVDTAENQVEVTVSMFGRETPATLELSQVAKLDD